LDFIRQHANWAALLVFGLAFGESLPFASLVLPFWAVLVGVGTIIAVADPLIFWTIVVAAAIGAALGDWLSYWLGSRSPVDVSSSPEQRRSSVQGAGVVGVTDQSTRR
jgi:membrane protein DedA with SNARE-associated domain